jgi:hypothetical protein
MATMMSTVDAFQPDVIVLNWQVFWVYHG